MTMEIKEAKAVIADEEMRRYISYSFRGHAQASLQCFPVLFLQVGNRLLED